MNVVRLPSTLAVVGTTSHVAARHWIVTATRHSESFRAFRSTDASASQTRFRFDRLLATDLAHALRLCRSVTEPNGAYNFSSPGDMGSVRASESTPSPDCGDAAINCAFMNVVERAPGDFVPNNMVYNALQKYIMTVPSSEGSSIVECSAARATPFESFLADVQNDTQHPMEADATADTERKLQEEGKENTNDNEKAIKSEKNMAITATAVVKEQTFYFFPYPVDVASGIPFLSKYFVVLVNLKPIVPGHLMVVPRRCVRTIHGLTEEEVVEWGRVVRLTIDVLDLRAKRLSGSTVDSDCSYSVAIQQGELAGQTVPHLHTHIIPFDPRGKLSGEPEAEEEEQKSRLPRTEAQMKEETDMFKELFQTVIRNNNSSKY